MSLSSFAINTKNTKSSVAGLLAESFAMLRDELPAAYERMCSRLSERAMEIRVDDERFLVQIGAGGARVRALGAEEDARKDASITTSTRAIQDVIEARRSLVEAVLTDEVQAVAPLDSLVEVLSGLTVYVHGAVRCPSFPRLLERFRALSAAREEI